MEDQIQRLEAVASRLEACARKMGGKKGGDDGDEVPAWVEEWNALVKKHKGALCDVFKGIDYVDLGAIVGKALDNITAYINQAGSCKKPNQGEMQQFLQPLLDASKAADDLTRTRNKKLFKWDTHHKAIYEIVQGMLWVSMAPPALPSSHAKGAVESADFHLNRILMKQKTDANVAWVKALRSYLKEQAEFVKENCKMGLEWNPKGGALGSGKAPKKEEPKEEKKAEEKKPAAKKKNAGNLVADLQKGLKATSGLKKVDRSQKTKYRKDRSGKVNMKVKKAKAGKDLPPPSKQKRGFMWMYQYNQEGFVEISEGDVNMKMGVFLSQNYNTTFMIKPKIKSLVIDSCHKCKIQVYDVVSSIELVNCKSVTVFCSGQLPTVTVDKCDSPRLIFLPEAFKHNPQVITSCVTAGNIEVPGKSEDDDMIEIPMPEQFVNTIDPETKKMTTVCMKHEG